MEEMVPELQDYVSRGYMSKEEARKVAAARRDHEYRLKRKAPLLADFLRYIEYETAVDDLVRARRRAIPREDRPKRGLADRAGERRIHFIYARACRKFRGDLSLWSSWLSFCAERGCGRKGGRVAAAALALHPREPALWAAAAAWEFGGGSSSGAFFRPSNGFGAGAEGSAEARRRTTKRRRKGGDSGSNPAAARALMQRGLRACGERCDELWAEYLRLELAYAATLRERRRVLRLLPEEGEREEEEKETKRSGKGDEGDESDESESEDEEEDEDELALSDDVDEEGGEENLPMPPPRPSKKQKKADKGQPAPSPSSAADAATTAVLEGEVAAVVARSAVAASPRNLDRRLCLLSALQGIGSKSPSISDDDLDLILLPGARRAAAELYSGLERDFPRDPRARAAVARRAVDEFELVERARVRGKEASGLVVAASDGAAAAAAALERSLSAFDAAVAELPSVEMFDEIVSFLKERLRAAEREREKEAASPPATPPQAPSPSSRKKKAAATTGQKPQQVASSPSASLVDLLNKKLERTCASAAAATPPAASEATLLEWPAAARRRGRVRAALSAAEAATTARALPPSAAVWRARLALLGKLAAAKRDEGALWGDLARATAEGAAAVGAAASAPLWRETFSALASAASEHGQLPPPAHEAFEELCEGLSASILASPCSRDPRGGLGGAAAAALAAAQALARGGDGNDADAGADDRRKRRRQGAAVAAARRSLAARLLAPGRPSPGADFFDALLRAEIAEALSLQRELDGDGGDDDGGGGGGADGDVDEGLSRKERQRQRKRLAASSAAAAAAVDRFVEAALSAPTSNDDARPWLHYLRWEQHRKGGEGVGKVHWRAERALRGEAAAEFASSASAAAASSTASF